MYIESPHDINFCNSFWTEDDDKLIEKEERNNKIQKIRECYLSDTKTDKSHNYENLGGYGYKSSAHKELFLENVEAAKLTRKYHNGRSHEDKLDYLFVDENRVGRDPVTQEDVDEYYSFKDLNKCQREKPED
jgi:hypothetical protein